MRSISNTPQQLELNFTRFHGPDGSFNPECRLHRLYQLSIQVKLAKRALVFVFQMRRAINSHDGRGTVHVGSASL